MNSRPLPECLAIILCDAIAREESSKKLTVSGVFNNIVASEFPARHRKMFVLLTLAGGWGEYELSLHIQHEETALDLLEFKGPFTMDDPSEVADLDVEIEDLLFPEPGRYCVCLSVDGTIIKQRPFAVRISESSHENG